MHGLRQSGFTIFEVAIAMFLLTLLFGTIFMPLQAQIENRKIEQTEELLARAREALLGYAATHGYLPCPADATGSGHEAAGSDHLAGTCPAYHGFLPAATLGFTTPGSDGYASDAWGTAAHRIRYAVSSQTIGPPGNTNALTRVNGMRAAGIADLGSSTLSLFHICSGAAGASASHCGSAGTLASTAPVVIWSGGVNAATGGDSMDEAQNPNAKGGSADRVFVSRVRSNVPGREFDDLVTWIPMPVLIGRMVMAGQLP